MEKRRKPESSGARIGLFGSYLINYSAATNLPFLTILTKAGLEQFSLLIKVGHTGDTLVTIGL